MMKPEEYKQLRVQIGTQVDVAKMLDVNYATICKRERGKWKISKEAGFAIKYLYRTKRGRS